MSIPSLELEAFGLAFGDRVILADVTLEVPPNGILVLLGPGGVGKSSLLRTISGANNANPSLRTWGRATLAGAPISPGWAPVLVAQKASLLIGTLFENLMSSYPERASLTQREQIEAARTLLSEAGLGALTDSLSRPVIDLPLGVQRRVAIIRSAAADPPLLCADEPTSELPDEEALAVIELLRKQAQRRGVVFVTHNQRHARAAGGTTALLAGGRVHEIAPTDEFFGAPLTRAAQQFVRTGSCGEPSPGARPEDLEEGVTPVPVPKAALAAVKESGGPRGFRWAKPGKLGGTPRPGVVDEVEYDLAALKRVGVTLLVTLELERFPEALLAPYGIKGAFFPFKDMSAPSIETALSQCEQIERLMAEGEAVALHCRAGLGRTGTMIVAQLIYEGKTALEALETARRIEPRWVQSKEQVEFLERFEHACKNRNHERQGEH